jgi:ADP-heptose:LPS heptosyltransferase
MARNRYGFYRKAATFKKGLHTHSIFFNASRHISEAYRQFALAAGLTEADCLPASLRILPEDREDCADAMNRLGIAPDARLLLVNPNASDLLLERRWPLEKWAALLETLPLEDDLTVLIVGAKGERDYAERLLNRLSEPRRGRVRNVAGEFSLGGFFALIERAALMATSDTGPLHFALALGCPTVSLWGPGDPSHYGPLEDPRHRVIYQPPYCSPCLYHADVTPCGGDNICMKGIAVETVASAVREVLAQNRELSHPKSVAGSATAGERP